MSIQTANSRDDLFDELKFDRLRPAEAEAEAAHRGWEPLAPLPAASAFDPTTEQYWTLPMAMTWIATRSVDAVRLAWNKYRAQYPDWRRTEWRDGPDGEVHKGWLLYPLDPVTSLGVELYAILGHFEGQEGFMPVPEVRKALWVALQENLFPATGLARLGGRVPIQADEWHSLEPTSVERRDEVGRQGGTLQYSEPLVPAKAIWHLWPARREPTGLPALMTPEGDGYMPLYCAARWIASRGGVREFDPGDPEIWKEAFDELLTAISSDKVRVVGLRTGETELIPGHKFVGVKVDYPHSDTPLDLLTTNEVYLRSYPYQDDQRWRGGFDDSLVNRRTELWTRLMVDKGDVRGRWLFDRDEGGTGAPGRRSKSMFLVVDEFERRAAVRTLEPHLRDEAKSLLAWLKDVHPTRDRPTLKTIENNLRQLYREAKKAPK